MQSITAEQLTEELKRTEALMSGHFKLASGLHSGNYLQCARLLQHPVLAGRIGSALADKFSSLDVNLVATPAIGGILVGHEVARALGVRSVFSEREDGVMKFRRGLDVDSGNRVVVVEDVITTGGSIRETMAAIVSAGAEVIAAGCIVDRSGGKTDLGCSLESLLQLTFPVYEPDDCPLCQNGTAAVKPGSKITG